MKIGIDAQTILNPDMGDAAGLGHYTCQLIRSLLEIDSENEYVIFANYRMRKKDLEKIDSYKNVKIRRFPYSEYKKFMPVFYSETLATAFFMRENLDVLHIPGGRMPVGYRGKVVTTAYNLAMSRHPELFPKKDIVKYRLKTPAYKRSKAVIVSSEYAKKDMKEFFYVKDEKIKVIENAFDQKFYKKASDEEIKKVKDKYEIDGKYILFMNTIKPINNLSRLIEAFSKLKMVLESEMPNSKYKLVLAGKSGWLGDEIHQIVKDFGLKKDVIFTGYVEPEDLNSLFGGAEIFVSVPVYEEFGSTVLEAFASEVPVVCSNVTSYPEITKGVAKLVDPYDIEGIKNSILEVLRNEKMRNEMIQKGIERSKDFSWKRTAEKTLKVFEEVVEK